MTLPLRAKCGVCGERPIRYVRTAECNRCYKRRWRRENGPAVERERAAARAWKASHPERHRRDTARKNGPERRGTCTGCGGLLGFDGAYRNKSKVCAGCLAVNAEVRRSLIRHLWLTGWKYPEIIAATGLSSGTIASILDDLRKAGEVPYRYAVAAARSAT